MHAIITIQRIPANIYFPSFKNASIAPINKAVRSQCRRKVEGINRRPAVALHVSLRLNSHCSATLAIPPPKKNPLSLWEERIPLIVIGRHSSQNWREHFQCMELITHSLSRKCTSYFQLSPRCWEMWSNTIFRVWYITSCTTVHFDLSGRARPN